MENNERQQFEAMLKEAGMWDEEIPVASRWNDDHLDLMQKAYDMPRWIACSERLPENRTYVLAFTPNGDYM